MNVLIKIVGLITICINETYIRCVEAKISLKVSYSEWPEKRRCFITTAFQLCFGIRH
jgi:hypothetical protein